MQLIFNAKNVIVGAVLVAGGYYGYRSFFADIETRDMPKLVRTFRDSQPARQLLIKQRILGLYQPSRDYDLFARELNSTSPITQALAVSVITAKGEGRAMPALLQMLRDPQRADIVKEEVARAFSVFRTKDAIGRLIELTDTSEPLGVRSAAHNTLKALTGVGGEIKLGDATREHWSLWWRDHPNAVSP